jgi:hypothetical protein
MVRTGLSARMRAVPGHRWKWFKSIPVPIFWTAMAIKKCLLNQGKGKLLLSIFLYPGKSILHRKSNSLGSCPLNS